MELELKNDRSLVRLALLVLLAERAGYGYDLARRLKETGLWAPGKDISPIYRSLKELESRQWVTGERTDTNTEPTGRPERRLFHITDTGRTAFEASLEVLNERLRKFSEFVARVNRLRGIPEDRSAPSMTSIPSSNTNPEPTSRANGLMDFD